MFVMIKETMTSNKFLFVSNNYRETVIRGWGFVKIEGGILRYEKVKVCSLQNQRDSDEMDEDFVKIKERHSERKDD